MKMEFFATQMQMLASHDGQMYASQVLKFQRRWRPIPDIRRAPPISARCSSSPIRT